MNFGEIKDEVSANLNRSLSEVNTRLGNWVKSAQGMVEAAGVKWWFLQQKHSFDTADGSKNYSLPALFRQLDSVSLIETTGYYKPLSDSNLLSIQSTYGTQEGEPACFALDSSGGEPGNLVLGPTPDAVYSMEMFYYAWLSELSADTDTNFLTNSYADLLIAEATRRGFRFLSDRERVNDWEKETASEFGKLWAANWAHIMTGPSRLRWRLGASVRSVKALSPREEQGYF